MNRIAERDAKPNTIAVVAGNDVDAEVRLHVDEVIERFDRRRRDRECVTNRHRHDPGVPVYTGNTNAVVSHCRHGASDVSAVAVSVHRDGGAVTRVDSENVVDVAIAIVVDPVARNLAGIDPHVGQKIGVVKIDPGIQDRDNRLRRTGDHIPSIWRTDIRAGSSAGLTCIFHRPHADVLRIVRNRSPLADPVWFGKEDFWNVGNVINLDRQFVIRLCADENRAGEPELLQHGQSELAQQFLFACFADAFVECHQQSAVDIINPGDQSLATRTLKLASARLLTTGGGRWGARRSLSKRAQVTLVPGIAGAVGGDFPARGERIHERPFHGCVGGASTDRFDAVIENASQRFDRLASDQRIGCKLQRQAAVVSHRNEVGTLWQRDRTDKRISPSHRTA